MTTTQQNIGTCLACGQENEVLRKRTWTHHDPYDTSGWAYDEGETVTEEYCSECINDIQKNEADYQRYLAENTEDITVEELGYLILKLVNACKRSTTNWKDWAMLNPRELFIVQDLDNRY